MSVFWRNAKSNCRPAVKNIFFLFSPHYLECVCVFTPSIYSKHVRFDAFHRR
jgi:hypothetical protein